MLNSTPARLGRFLSLLLLLALSAGAAQAATFDFTGSARTNEHGLETGDLGHRLRLSDEGITLQVRAFDAPGDRGSIHRTRNGLGVASNPNRGAVGSLESLVFSFSGPAVSVSGLIFERGATNGRLDLYVDGAFEETIRWTTGGGTVVAHDLGDLSGSRFELRGDVRSFRVSRLTASVPIPEPSAAMLFAAGALAVGRATRRRTA